MSERGDGCTHRRQVCVAGEWLCEDCLAVMDADDPTWVLAEVVES